MHTNEPREDPLVDLGYEIRDVDYPKLRKAIIIFFAFGAACAVAGWFIYAYRYNFFAVNGGALRTNALKRRLPEFPNPELQNNVTSKTDIALMRRFEDERLHSTGYVDKGQTRVHIPIEQAMAVIAKNGLTPTGNSVPAQSRGNETGQNRMPTESTTSDVPAGVRSGPSSKSTPEIPPTHQTTGSSVPGTSNGTRNVPPVGDPHAAANKPGAKPIVP